MRPYRILLKPLRQPRKVAITVGIIAFLITVIAIIFAIYSYRRPLPQTSGIVFVPGLLGNVTVYRDEWGVPHIYAENVHDLFFAQGYVHAQDRWWQMEMNRHLGMGEMSAILGEDDDAQNYDRFVRAVGWNRIAEANMAASSSETRSVLRSYAAGVNTYIGDQDAGDLAVQYTMLGLAGRGFEVTPWRSVDSVAWSVAFSWGMNGNLGEEFDNLYLRENLPPDLRRAFLPTQPDAPQVMDNGGVPSQLIGNLDPLNLPFLGTDVHLTSSGWIVDGSLTESGKPLLVNEMQAGMRMPSPWYEVGLHCVEVTPQCPFDVVGFSLPSLPGVLVGHNSRVAWGLLNTMTDTQDLYILRLNPANPLEYDMDGEWQPMRVIIETIPINDAPSLQRAVYLTDFGPLVSPSPQVGDLYGLALRWSGSEQNDFVENILHLDKSEALEDFRAGFSNWHGASMIILYADVDNHKGMQMTGSLPIRADDHTGLAPIEGWTDDYMWRSFFPEDELAGGYDDQALILYANQADTHEAHIGWFSWQAEGRLARILTLLNQDEGAQTPDSLTAVQADVYYSHYAPLLCEQLFTLDFTAPEDENLLDFQTWLRGWDYQMSENSPHAALFGLFWAQLAQSTFGDQLAMHGSLTPAYTALVNLLSEPESLWWDDLSTSELIETRDAALREAFVRAIDDAEGRLGANRDDWQWGSLHTVTFKSVPLGNVPGASEILNRGPFPVSGDLTTVFSTPWSLAEEDRFETLTAPSFRIIIDLSNFDNSRSILSTGQSGHPASPHYDDMIDLWRSVAYRDMLWDRNHVREENVSTLRLRPMPLQP